MIKKTCLICGKEFEVIPCRKDTAKYCSTECQSKALHGKPNCVCEVCGKEYHCKPSQIKRYKHHTCSRECIAELKKKLYCGEGNHQFGLKGKLNSSYKGKELARKNNNIIDIWVYSPEHPHCDKYGRVTKHRLIVEEHYKQFDAKYFETVGDKVVLKKSTQVHHINFDHNDNRIENLMPVTRSEHSTIHNMGIEIMRDKTTGRITGVVKRGELLEKPEAVNQQPSSNGDVLEGSETNSRVLRDSNADTSALPLSKSDDIVRTTCITKEDVEIHG